MLDKGNAVNLNEIRVCQTKDLIFSFFNKRQLSASLSNIFPAAVSLSLLVKGRHPASCLLDSTSPEHDHFKGRVYVNLVPGCYLRGFYYIILC